MNYYERHIGDYLKDTAHLSLLEHGIYARLLDVYYTRECGIDEGMAARLVGARSDEELAALKTVLFEFFELIGGIYIQARCDREIERFKGKQAQAQRAAQASVASRQASAQRPQNAGSTDAEPTLNVPSLQTPVSIPKEKKRAKPPASLTVGELEAQGISTDAAVEFLALRNRKGAKLTPRAWDAIRVEIHKAGWTAEQAITKCLARGWTGFEADWVKDERQKKADIARMTVPNPETLEQEQARLHADRMTPEQWEASKKARLAVMSAVKNITPQAA